MKIGWTQFKTLRNARETDILMVEDSFFYYLFTTEHGFNLECEIDKNVSDTTNLDDFEDNYKSLCNPVRVEKVKPTAPSNDYEMKPYGLSHAHIDASSNYIYDITLSNKSGNSYNYTCNTNPTTYDCICNTDTSILDEIEEVDIINGDLELFEARLGNSTHKLIKPKIIDFKLPTEYSAYQLWGCFVHIKDFGDDDHVCLQIIDIDDVLGYGANTVLKEYDEVWAHTLAKSTGGLYSPDEAPGELPAGVYGRVLYYPKDNTKTDIKIWIDYILTIKS